MQTLQDILEAAEVKHPQLGQQLTAVQIRRSYERKPEIILVPSALLAGVNDFVSSQRGQPLAVSSPVGSACGGSATFVVQVYTFGRGVSVKGQARDLCRAQSGFKFETGYRVLAFNPFAAAITKQPVLAVEDYITAVGLQLQVVDQEQVPEGCRELSHEGIQSQTVILSLPPASGKSIIADALATTLGCKYIVDEWSPRLPLLKDALHLTNVTLPASFVDGVEPHAKTDLARYTAAFLHWENDYRLKPADFLTAEEVAALDAPDISAQRAAWFIGCLRAAEATAQVPA